MVMTSIPGLLATRSSSIRKSIFPGKLYDLLHAHLDSPTLNCACHRVGCLAPRSCATNEDYYGGYFENDNGNNYNYNQNGNNGNNYYNNDQDEYAGLYQQKLVHFKLCPSDTSCWRCKNGADYVVELGVFAQAMLQAKMTADEYDCNRVREGCDCEGASSEYYCLMGCFKNAGVDSSVCDNSSNDRNDDNMFSLQEAMECARLEVDDEDEVKAYIWANTNRGQAQNNGYYDANGNGQQDMQEQMENIDGDIYVGPCE